MRESAVVCSHVVCVVVSRITFRRITEFHGIILIGSDFLSAQIFLLSAPKRHRIFSFDAKFYSSNTEKNILSKKTVKIRPLCSAIMAASNYGRDVSIGLSHSHSLQKVRCPEVYLFLPFQQKNII